MLSLPMMILLAYVAVISLVSIVVCFYDKKISKRNNVKLRIPEATLLGLSAVGGSVAMFLCMLAIRHKTKHFKFMVGIPVIIVLQAVLIGYLITSGILPVFA
jgi:uncharacterized membrane protein YsdA (DUF1294 family)